MQLRKAVIVMLIGLDIRQYFIKDDIFIIIYNMIYH